MNTKRGCLMGSAILALMLGACSGGGSVMVNDVGADAIDAAEIADATAESGPELDAAWEIVPETVSDAVAEDVSDPGLDANADIEAEIWVDPEGDALEVLPDALPFEFTRLAEGEPLNDDEMRAFTCKVTKFWKDTKFFQWALDTNWSSDPSTGRREYKTWWTGLDAVKAGSRVTFKANPSGGPDNTMIPHSRILSGAATAYLLTGNVIAGEVARTLALGTSATMLGMVWNADDPVRSIMARAVVASDQVVDIGSGREAATDFTAWRHEACAWNTCWMNIPENPYWGDVWVKNKRSKDDVPHIYLSAVWLRFLSEKVQDAGVREAATEAWQMLQGFAHDIVDSGYNIRTKDKDGNIYTPNQDLASFVMYTVFEPLAECSGRLSSALLATGSTLGIDCGTGDLGSYEDLAVIGNYYNLAILRNFHTSSVLLALINGRNNTAKLLLQGLTQRVDRDFARDISKLGVTLEQWESDLAVHLLLSASAGLPLKWKEVRLLQHYYSDSIDVLAAWPYWDMWNPAVSDGTYPHRPWAEVDIEDMLFFLEYCYSPFQNASGAPPVDCEIVADITQWGCP